MIAGADVAIVGGGVIGLALARELSSRGADVVVIERGRTGEEASSAAAGLLSAQADALAPALALAPSLERARFADAWAGLRPGTPDGLPLLGETPIRNLFLAAGHFRNGVLLAPLTALVIADLLCGAPPRDLSAFSPERFVEAARRR